ncbi:MAG TPA: hypothetical protein VGM66_04625 [Candidatus Udaeobacter sp.]
MSEDREPSFRGWLPLAAVIGLAAVAFIAGRIGNHYRAERAARGESPPSLDPHMFGTFLLAGALAIALQTYYSYKQGWVYGEFWRKVYRDDQPNAFLIRLCLQILFVLFLAFFGVRGLLR